MAQAKRCGGALVWQINDRWPGTSWAIVDYYLRKKASYYALSRVLAPIAVTVQREHHDWSVAHARPTKSSQFQMRVVSSQMKLLDATVKLRFICIETGENNKTAVTKKIQLVANGTTEVLTGVIDNISVKPHVLAATVFVDGTIVSRDVDWPQGAFGHQPCVEVSLSGSVMVRV